MNLARKITQLATEPPASAPDQRKAAIKLAADLCVARSRISALEAEASGLREALLALNRHDGLARDFAAVRDTEREACARLMDTLSFCIGAKAIRERA